MKKFLGLFVAAAMIFPAAASAQFGWGKVVPDLPGASLAVPDVQVRNSMITHLEQLNQYCPLAGRPDDFDRCKSLSANVRMLSGKVELQNRVIPEYIQVVELLDKIEKQIPTWDKQEKADADARKLADQITEEFKTKLRDHGVVGTIWTVKNNLTERLDMSSELMLKDVEKAKAMEKEFLEPCKAGRYANVNNFSKETDSDHPKNVCDVAENWKTYYKAYVERVLDSARTRTVNIIAGHIKKLEETGEIYESDMPRLVKPADAVAALVTSHAPIAKEFGIALDAKYFASVVEATKPYAAAMKKAGAIQHWDDKASFSDKEVNAAFTKALTDEKLSVKKIGLVQSDYSVTKNDFGIPLYKIRSGYVMVKASGEAACRIYYLSVRSDYVGGLEGYTKPFISFDRKDEGFVVSKCK